MEDENEDDETCRFECNRTKIIIMSVIIGVIALILIILFATPVRDSIFPPKSTFLAINDQKGSYTASELHSSEWS